MQVSIEDQIAMLLGKKDVEILLLRNKLAEAQQRLAELEPKPDAQPKLEAVQ